MPSFCVSPVWPSLSLQVRCLWSSGRGWDSPVESRRGPSLFRPRCTKQEPSRSATETWDAHLSKPVHNTSLPCWITDDWVPFFPPSLFCSPDTIVVRCDRFSWASGEGRSVWCLHGHVTRSEIMLIHVLFFGAVLPLKKHKRSSEAYFLGSSYNPEISLTQRPNGGRFTSTTGSRWTRQRSQTTLLLSSLHCLVSAPTAHINQPKNIQFNTQSVSFFLCLSLPAARQLRALPLIQPNLGL